MGFGGGGFFGGGADQSSSSNITTTTTTNTSGALSETEDSWLISAAGGVTLSDPNLVKSAFQFASESLGLVERRASDQQKSFEGALAQTLNIADATKTAGSERLLWLGVAALVGLIGIAYVVKT